MKAQDTEGTLTKSTSLRGVRFDKSTECENTMADGTEATDCRSCGVKRGAAKAALEGYSNCELHLPRLC